MEIVGKFLLFGGLIVAIIIQLYIMVLTFQDKFIRGLLSFVVPAYVSFYAWCRRKEPRL